MLETFTSARTPCQHFFKDKIHNTSNNLYDLCVNRTTQWEPCRHVRHALRDIGSDNATWSWRAFSIMLTDLLYDRSCDWYWPLFEKFILGAKLHHIASQPEVDAANVLKESKAMETADGKRRRIDEDFKKAVGELSIDSGTTPTTLCNFQYMCSDTKAKDTQSKAGV